MAEERYEVYNDNFIMDKIQDQIEHRYQTYLWEAQAPPNTETKPQTWLQEINYPKEKRKHRPYRRQVTNAYSMPQGHMHRLSLPVTG